MKIGFGCDHAAVELKNVLLAHLKEQGHECVDFGSYDPNMKVNYPEKGLEVAEAILRGEIDKGVLVCGTGVGISLAANKVPASGPPCAASPTPLSSRCATTTPISSPWAPGWWATSWPK